MLPRLVQSYPSIIREREGYLGSERLLDDGVRGRCQDRWDPSDRVTYEYIRNVTFVEGNTYIRFCMSLRVFCLLDKGV